MHSLKDDQHVEENAPCTTSNMTSETIYKIWLGQPESRKFEKCSRSYQFIKHCLMY